MADAPTDVAAVRAPEELASGGSISSGGRPDSDTVLRPTPGGGESAPSAGGYDTFARDELAIVLSRWDIGAIEQLEEFRRGSRRAPKLAIKSSRGRFLLKRRAPSRDEASRVQFSHAIQAELSTKQFPLPHLQPTREGGQTYFSHDNHFYELFEFIPGHLYNQSADTTADSGRVLALYHKLLERFKPPVDPPTGSYHAAPAVEKGFDHILRHLSRRSDVAPLCRFLLDSYLHARDVAEDAGIARWPRQIVHGDWHPGNMLYRDGHVAAVIDYDSARLLPRVVDCANGALQFSILGGGDDLAQWPAHVDDNRFRRFLRSYDEVTILSQAELRAVPWLMVEALIAEAVHPIAATGQFGKLEGTAFLGMVQRKVVWLQQNADRLVEMLST